MVSLLERESELLARPQGAAYCLPSGACGFVFSACALLVYSKRFLHAVNSLHPAHVVTAIVPAYGWFNLWFLLPSSNLVLWSKY